MDSSSTNSNSNLITFPCTSNDTNSIPLLSKEQLNSLCGVKLVNDVCDAGNSSDPTQKFLSRTSLPPGSRVIEPGQMVTMVLFLLFLTN